MLVVDLISIPLRLQLASNPFASIDANTCDCRVCLSVGDGDYLFRVMVRLLLARLRVLLNGRV